MTFSSEEFVPHPVYQNENWKTEIITDIMSSTNLNYSKDDCEKKISMSIHSQLKKAAKKLYDENSILSRKNHDLVRELSAMKMKWEKLLQNIESLEKEFECSD